MLLGNWDVGLAVDAAAHRLYAANFMADSVSVIDTTTTKVVAAWPTGVGPGTWRSPRAPAGLLHELDRRDDEHPGLGDGRHQVPTVRRAIPMVVAVDHSTHRVYVAAKNALSVAVVDGSTQLLVTTITVGNTPSGIAIDSAGQRVFVANHYTDTAFSRSGQMFDITEIIQRATGTWRRAVARAVVVSPRSGPPGMCTHCGRSQTTAGS